MAIYKVVGIGQLGKFFDEKSYFDVINYIADPDSAAFTGGAGITSIDSAANEMQATAAAFGKNSGKRLRHSVLSFDDRENITPDMANKFAQEIIQHYAPEYQIAYAVHTNTDDVHIHFVMNHISYVDGHRYAGKKQDYYAFQRHMKEVTQLPILLSKDHSSALPDSAQNEIS